MDILGPSLDENMQPSTPCCQHQQLRPTVCARWAKMSFPLFTTTFLWADFLFFNHTVLWSSTPMCISKAPDWIKDAISCVLMPTTTTSNHCKHRVSKMLFAFLQPLYCQLIFSILCCLNCATTNFVLHSLNSKVSEHMSEIIQQSAKKWWLWLLDNHIKTKFYCCNLTVFLKMYSLLNSILIYNLVG